MKITGKILAGFFMPDGFENGLSPPRGGGEPALDPPLTGRYRRFYPSLTIRDFSKTEVFVTVIAGDCRNSQSNQVGNFI